MVKVFIVFKSGHVICVSTNESMIEAIRVAEYHQEYVDTNDCHFEVRTEAGMVHSTKQS